MCSLCAFTSRLLGSAAPGSDGPALHRQRSGRKAVINPGGVVGGGSSSFSHSSLFVLKMSKMVPFKKGSSVFNWAKVIFRVKRDQSALWEDAYLVVFLL